MKVHCFIVIVSFLIKLFTVKGDSGNITSTYNAEEILSKIFNFTTPVSARQFNNGLIKFDDSSPFGDGKPNSVINFEGQPGQSFKFEDDYIVQNLQDSGPQSTQTFKFEDDESNAIQNTANNEHFARPNQPLKFGDDQSNLAISQNLDSNQEGYGFQDDNNIEEHKPLKKKRRRRRRKPRYQGLYPGYPGYVGPQGVPPIPTYPGNGVPQGLVQSGQHPHQYTYPGVPASPFYRPPRRPKPSIASEALSAITGALSSIAQYDDYQCVPRLLCEAAGGGALGSSSVLQNIAGLQPLLTLLAAYNGISSSPLFIFGRAVFLGMTSKGNLGTCRYGYPQCPTDPEQLVHYLNNHNGGFFRFFNAPSNSQNQQQNLQQFYNQLSLPQNNGLYQADQSSVPQNYGLYPASAQQNYDFPNFEQFPQPGYGFQNPIHQNNEIGPQNYGFNYPHQHNNQQGYGIQNPYLYEHVVGPQNYSPNYPHQYNYNNIGPQNYGQSYPYKNKYLLHKNKFKNNSDDIKANRIEKRIQNKPSIVYIEESTSYNDNIDQNSNWAFPENNIKYNFHYARDPSIDDNVKNYIRDGNVLKFPEEDTTKYNVAHNDFNRKGKGFLFPNENLRYVNYYAPPHENIHNSNNFGFTSQNKESNKEFLKYENNNNKVNNNYYKYQGTVYNNFESNYNTLNQNINNDDGLETVYILRGNGDPNNPEIVKLKPGEIIH